MTSQQAGPSLGRYRYDARRYIPGIMLDVMSRCCYVCRNNLYRISILHSVYLYIYMKSETSLVITNVIGVNTIPV